MGVYCNPADKLLTLAANPRSYIKKVTILTRDQTQQVALLRLEQICKAHVEKFLSKNKSEKFNLNETLNVNTMKESTKVNLQTQIKLLTNRFILQTCRIPAAAIACAV